MIKNYVYNSGAQKTWTMIGGEKGSNESFEKTIIRKIKEEMNIKIDDIKFLSNNISENKDTYFYHGKLTDNNVNLMQRAEGQELQFFDFDELNKIELTGSVNFFLKQNRDVMEDLLIN
jgi:ADP-ribose pyrophosphatase YjhB (NUDIX family)